MPTLRSVLETANGLYRDMNTGKGYLRQDLLAQLSEEALAVPIQIKKIRPGVYAIHLNGPRDGTYELFSRRRTERSS
ncbi:MAG TPA: hypothetical protein VF221_03065 [Chloroflexota bacterium]